MGFWKTVGKYFFNLAYAIDQLGNACTGGSPDETLSSRLGRYRYEKGDTFFSKIGLAVGRIVSRFLDLFQKDHVTESIEPEYARRDEILK